MTSWATGLALSLGDQHIFGVEQGILFERSNFLDRVDSEQEQ